MDRCLIPCGFDHNVHRGVRALLLLGVLNILVVVVDLSELQLFEVRVVGALLYLREQFSSHVVEPLDVDHDIGDHVQRVYLVEVDLVHTQLLGIGELYGEVGVLLHEQGGRPADRG